MKKVFLAIFCLCIIFFNLNMAGFSSESALSNKEKNIVYISSCCAKGDLIGLDSAINKALDEKMTIYEIKEILLQLYAYCGFPRSINALTVFMKVEDERSAKGIYDAYGSEPVDLTDDKNRLDIGTAVQTELVGAPVTGRLYEFEPALDKFLKEHLFADIFSRGVLSYEEREIATISALSSMTNVEPQFNSHIQIGLNAGVSKQKIDEIKFLTQKNKDKTEIFSRGVENRAYSNYFSGKNYLNILNKEGVGVYNITFEPKCRNNWHVHHKGGQILLVTQGRGYYQEWGKPARELKAGDTVNVPPEVKHWHGASKDSWFVHIVIEVPSKGGYTEWLEPVKDDDYNLLK